jgi:histidinol-phosphate aminotransferase
MHPIITRTVGTTWVDGLRGVEGAGAFDLDVTQPWQQVREHQPNIVFLCSPNNPTGTRLGLDVVGRLYDAAPARSWSWTRPTPSSPAPARRAH